MTSLPETKYTKSGDVSIAYQVMGDGPIDLFVVPCVFSHVECWHELPGYTAFLRCLASFARVVTFDLRGTGLSDRAGSLPILDERIDDVSSVMAAISSEHAVLFGWNAGGMTAALFAAMYPQKTRALITYGTAARGLRAPDYPFGFDPELFRDAVAKLSEVWGEGALLDLMAPSVARDREWRSSWAKFERLSLSPGLARALGETQPLLDIRPILETIQVPTLVLHRSEDPFVPLDAGRHMAEHIPGARFVEVDGSDHLFLVGETDSVLDEIEKFVTGERRIVSDERVLATVLFTDIVGSTEHAAELGDHRWRQLLDSHDDLVGRQVNRLRGRLVKTTGDGILATFDGPARAINCASAIRDGVRALGLETRAGLHIGEIELRSDDIGGIAVHIAARVLDKAQPGEVLVSRTLTDLVAGSGLRFEDRGEHELKGVAQRWHLFAAQA